MGEELGQGLIMERYTRPLPALKSGPGAWGSEGRIPDVTMVGTELVMELGGASIPDGCNGGSGGGGPVSDRTQLITKKQNNNLTNQFATAKITCLNNEIKNKLQHYMHFCLTIET